LSQGLAMSQTLSVAQTGLELLILLGYSYLKLKRQAGHPARKLRRPSLTLLELIVSKPLLCPPWICSELSQFTHKKTKAQRG
jgi:hypothetical protein